MTSQDKAYDPVPDLAALVISALYGRHDAPYWAEKVATGCGFDDEATPETVAGALREALGLAGTCELVTARLGTPCPHPAVTRLTGTCEHGHVTERLVCEDHRTPGRPLWCRACYRLPEPDGHECPVDLLPAGAVARAVTPGQGSGNAQG